MPTSGDSFLPEITAGVSISIKSRLAQEIAHRKFIKLYTIHEE
jgi:hypothetical protein